MNSSISSADATTHLKIVVTGLAAAIAVVWIGLAARISSAANAATVATSAASAASFVVTNESKNL
jgi:hypothetical protein